MTVKVGPVQGRFQGALALSDLVPPESYRMTLDGSGPSGFLRGEGAPPAPPPRASRPHLEFSSNLLSFRASDEMHARELDGSSAGRQSL